jgi:hypothetical protein
MSTPPPPAPPGVSNLSFMLYRYRRDGRRHATDHPPENIAKCARSVRPCSCASPPATPPARAGFPPKTEQKTEILAVTPVRLRATIVAVRASYYSTTPPAGARRRRALSMPPLPRPPQPRHRMVLAAIAVIAVIAVIAAAPYGLDGYCRIGLYAIAYERTIMPSRRTRKRRGHHHPTRHAQWRRSIDQPPRERLTRASTTPGARLQRTPVRTHRSPSAVPVHERRTGTYAPIAERRTGTHVPIAERDSPHRDVEVAPLRARPWVISASSRPHLGSSRPHLGLISASSRPHLGLSEARLRLRALDLEQLIGHRGELLRLVECL